MGTGGGIGSAFSNTLNRKKIEEMPVDSAFLLFLNNILLLY